MTKAEIEKFYNQYATPLHVRKHCATVAKLALNIADKLIKKGYRIDRESLKVACLLHDLVRVIDFKNWQPEKFAPNATKRELKIWRDLRQKYHSQHHADVAAKILYQKGYRKIAALIKAHKFENIFTPKKTLSTLEKKLIYYADKRVMHDQIVSLKERLIEGYFRNTAKKSLTKKYLSAVEKIIKLEGVIASAAKQSRRKTN